MQQNLKQFVREMKKRSEHIRQSGVAGRSRPVTANMVGISRMVAFDQLRPKSLVLSLWMLSTLTEKQLESHYQFICDTVLKKPVVPGEIDSEHHDLIKKIVLEESPGKPELNDIMLRFMIQGESLEDMGVTRSKKQNLTMKIQAATYRFKQAIGKVPDIQYFVEKIDARLKVVDPEIMLALITQQVPQRIQSKEVWLTPHEVSLFNLAITMPSEAFDALEAFYDTGLERIERFRHEHFTLIRKIYPILIEGVEKGKKAPLSASFFDHDKRAKPPSIEEIAKLCEMMNEIDALPPYLVRQKLDEHYGENKRIRYSNPAKAKILLEGGQVKNVYEAHDRVDKEMDTAQFYRFYKSWEEKSRFEPYWRKMSGGGES